MRDVLKRNPVLGNEKLSVDFLHRYLPSSTYTLNSICVCRLTVLSPVSLPDMDSLLVHIVVFQRLLIQEVKEIFDSRWHHCPRAQHTAEEVIYKLLQCSLKDVRQRHITAVRRIYLHVMRLEILRLYFIIFCQKTSI